jgi:ABC-2 type transport system permease protein
MKRFWGFVVKEFFHIFRDKRTLLILFGMPVAQMMIFGYVVKNEIADVKISILDKSQDVVTKKITDKLLSSGYFVLDRKLSTDADIEQSFRSGRVKEVVVFEPHFAEKLDKEGKVSIHLIADASDANTATLITSYTTAIVNSYIAEENRAAAIPMQIIPEVRMFYNEELKSVFMFVPGTMTMILMLISALMTSISIVREKEMGTMEVLLVSPLRPLQIVIGKVMPYAALSFINTVSILALSYFVFGLPMRGNLVLLLGESMLFIMLALSLGILISTVTNSQLTAMLISMVALMLPTILLSGFIFPIENMPLVLQGLCQIMPPKWFIIILKGIMLKGSGIAGVWKQTAVLAGMTLLFIGMSVRRFKIRMD